GEEERLGEVLRFLGAGLPLHPQVLVDRLPVALDERRERGPPHLGVRIAAGQNHRAAGRWKWTGHTPAPRNAALCAPASARAFSVRVVLTRLGPAVSPRASFPGLRVAPAPASRRS